MKKIILFSLFLLVSFWSIGQHDDHEVEIDIEVINEIRTISEKAAWLIHSDLDSALFYVRKGFQMASDVNDHQGIFDNMLLLGDGFIKVGEFEEALVLYQEANELLEELPATAKLILVQKRGLAYASLKKYEKALDKYQEVLTATTPVNNPTLHTSTLIYKGSIYRAQGLDSLAMAIQTQALALTKENDLPALRSTCLTEMGLIYELKSTLDIAISYFQQVLETENGVLHLKDRASVLNMLSRVYQKSMNPKLSIINAEKSLNLAKEKKDYKNASIACENLAKCYQLLNQPKFVNKYQLLSTNYREKYLTIEREKISTILKTSYELNKKELENHLLRENEVILKKGIRQNRLTIALICIALIFAILLASLFSIFNRNKKKTNNLLKEQNAEINAQRKDLEKAMNKLKTTQKQLLQSEKMASIGLLTAGVAHEINNPINFVHSGINGLEKNLAALLKVTAQYDTIKNKEDFEVIYTQIQDLKVRIDYEEVIVDINKLMVSIKDGAERVEEIVLGLSTFSRVDSEELQPVDIHHNLDATLVLLNSQLKGKIEVNKQYDANLAKIESYNGQLKQVFLNILINATQAILPDKGRIQITTKELEKTVEIEITDTGTGISADQLKHIFDPFFTTKNVGEGTGLGLSISYGIIEKHQGKIRVRSEVNKGTTFCISLPKQQNDIL